MRYTTDEVPDDKRLSMRGGTSSWREHPSAPQVVLKLTHTHRHTRLCFWWEVLERDGGVSGDLPIFLCFSRIGISLRPPLEISRLRTEYSQMPALRTREKPKKTTKQVRSRHCPLDNVLLLYSRPGPRLQNNSNEPRYKTTAMNQCLAYI